MNIQKSSSCTMQQPDGSPMDFSKTPVWKEAEAGVVSDSVFGLLKKEGDRWKVLATAVGPTDVPILCWWKDFGAPKNLFPDGMAVEQCE